MEFDVNVEKLSQAERRRAEKLDAEDRTAAKVCLFSAGALLGLSVKNRFVRRLTGLTCAVLAAGLGIPLVSRCLEELREEGEPLVDFKVEREGDPEDDPLFEFKVEPEPAPGDEAPERQDPPPAEG